MLFQEFNFEGIVKLGKYNMGMINCLESSMESLEM
jgi:hypothetical protein